MPRKPNNVEVSHVPLPSFYERAPGVWIPQGYRPSRWEQPTPIVRTADEAAAEYLRCANSLSHFAFHACWALHTDDPSHVPTYRKIPTYPYLVDFFKRAQVPENLHIEKSRQLLMSWAWMVVFLWDILFHDAWANLAISRKEVLVDDGAWSSSQDSLFGKLRILWSSLPPYLQHPLQFRHLRVTCPATGSYVKGESGATGGGRGATYKRALIDEAAHVPRSETMFRAVHEAAKHGLVLNSTPLGKNNVFARIRFQGGTTFKRISYHWLAHPEKSVGAYCTCGWSSEGEPASRKTDKEKYDQHVCFISPDPNEPYPRHPRSPWYDSATADYTPEQIASEFDLSYERSMRGRVFDPFDETRHVRDYMDLVGGPKRESETAVTYRRRYLLSILNPRLTTVCFVPGSRVTMADGTTKRIETVAIGDHVIAEDGHPHEVVRTVATPYAGDVVTMNVVGHDAFTCTTDHQLLVSPRRPIERQRRGFSGLLDLSRWVPAGQVEPGEYLLSPVISGDERPAPPLAVCRIAGYFLAEGSYIKVPGTQLKRGLTFTLGVNDEVTGMVNDLCSALMECGYRFSVWRRANVIAVTVRSCQALIESMWTLCGEYSHQKHLPADVLYWPIDAKRAFMSAYWSGDGCEITTGRGWPVASARTVSRDIADGLRAVLESVNISCRVSFVKAHDNRGDTWSVEANGAHAIALSRFLADGVVSRGVRDLHQKMFCENGRHHYRVKSVHRAQYVGPVYTLTVKDVHSYLVSGLIVKNCGWDFGVGDPTSLVLGQVIDDSTMKIRWIDEYEKNNASWDHFHKFVQGLWAPIVKEKTGKDILHYGDPSGANRGHHLDSWVSNMAAANPPIVIIKGPKVGEKLEWLDLIADLMRKGHFEVSSWCAHLVDVCGQYHFPLDGEGNPVPGAHEPVHDEWCHAADSLRYVMMFRYHSRLKDIYQKSVPAFDLLSAGDNVDASFEPRF